METGPVPIRDGETLGDYYHWSRDLWFALCESYWKQAFEQQNYNGTKPSVENCPSAQELGIKNPD